MTNHSPDVISQELNPAQRGAVEYVNGPLLIVAGPGSGKTRVITHRVAYLINRVGIGPGRIAAVTFTNRAAREMRVRLDHLLGDRARAMTAATFHGLCAQILRRDGEAIGLAREFVIMDAEDQIGLVKRAMEIEEVDPKRFRPRSILNNISSAKSKLLSPEGLIEQSVGDNDDVVRRVFIQYESLLARSRGVDFDDLLSKTLELLRSVPDVGRKYQEKFLHLMVDEFQDTNIAQYEIAKHLSAKYRNLTVVGDPNQAIYSWRNAEIGNILSFEEDFPDANVVHLSQNYRSTSAILHAAHSLIAKNTSRLDQELFTTNGSGVPVVIEVAENGEREAFLIVQEIDRLTRDEGYGLRDCVVTYRVNAQSRVLEEACLRYGLPYKLVGGIRFYQRREVKDIIAYLRLLQDPYDETSLTRVINVPLRGIGEKTVDVLLSWASNLGIPAYSALQILADDEMGGSQFGATELFSERQRTLLISFLALIDDMRHLTAKMDLSAIIGEVLERTGYHRALLGSDDLDAEDRLDNLREFRGLSSEYDEQPAAESLTSFLESIALVSEQDALTDDDQQYLTLITLHQIKGLEYPVVFIAGMEENLLPHKRSLENPDPQELEEERRLAYVGMTRACQRLYLLRCEWRRLFGETKKAEPSQFLKDIGDNVSSMTNPSLRDGPSWRSSDYGDSGSIVDKEAGAGLSVDKADSTLLQTGDKVTHKVFGHGMVVSCNPIPGDFEVIVAFPGSGVKRLLYSLADLQKIGQKE